MNSSHGVTLSLLRELGRREERVHGKGVGASDGS